MELSPFICTWMSATLFMDHVLMIALSDFWTSRKQNVGVSFSKLSKGEEKLLMEKSKLVSRWGPQFLHKGITGTCVFVQVFQFPSFLQPAFSILKLFGKYCNSYSSQIFSVSEFEWTFSAFTNSVTFLCLTHLQWLLIYGGLVQWGVDFSIWTGDEQQDICEISVLTEKRIPEAVRVK